MIHTLAFDTSKIEDEAAYYRALNSEAYVMALFAIKKHTSALPNNPTKAKLLEILKEIHSVVEDCGV